MNQCSLNFHSVSNVMQYCRQLWFGSEDSLAVGFRMLDEPLQCNVCERKMRTESAFFYFISMTGDNDVSRTQDLGSSGDAHPLPILLALMYQFKVLLLLGMT